MAENHLLCMMRVWHIAWNEKNVQTLTQIHSHEYGVASWRISNLHSWHRRETHNPWPVLSHRLLANISFSFSRPSNATSNNIAWNPFWDQLRWIHINSMASAEGWIPWMLCVYRVKCVLISASPSYPPKHTHSHNQAAITNTTGEWLRCEHKPTHNPGHHNIQHVAVGTESARTIQTPFTPHILYTHTHTRPTHAHMYRRRDHVQIFDIRIITQNKSVSRSANRMRWDIVLVCVFVCIVWASNGWLRVNVRFNRYSFV